MVLEIRQQLKLSQQLVMTPQLQMAIKLLQLSRLELVDAITQELEENPALEEIQEEADRDEAGNRETDADAKNNESETKEVTIEEKINDDIDWSNYLEEYNSTGKSSFEAEGKDAPQYEAFISKKENLSDHLLWQLLMTSPDKENENIASLIIGNLNRNGFLDIEIEDIAQMADASIEKVEDVLALLQTFDPVGVCAKNLQDSLIIQAMYYGCDNNLVFKIIDNHINNLENKNYKAIAKALKTNIKRVVTAVNFITGLDPRPGLKYNTEEPQYITPDIYVYKMDNEFVIILNDEGMPRIRLSAFYQEAMSNKGEMGGKTRDYMQEKMRSASWLIKSIHQRQKTIYKVTESILKFQKEFFEKGVAYLKPMILRDVAEDIDMHESTISRVTTNKYVYTEQGIFELKYFFNSSINQFEGDALSSASVQQKIKQVIENEDSKKPLSDEKISQILKESNIDIARRTVAKYREIMKILPSNKRKQF